MAVIFGVQKAVMVGDQIMLNAPADMIIHICPELLATHGGCNNIGVARLRPIEADDGDSPCKNSAQPGQFPAHMVSRSC